MSWRNRRRKSKREW